MLTRPPYLLDKEIVNDLQARAAKFYAKISLLDDFVYFLQLALDSKKLSMKEVQYLLRAGRFISHLINTTSLFATFIQANATTNEQITGSFNPDKTPLQNLLKDFELLGTNLRLVIRSNKTLADVCSIEESKKAQQVLDAIKLSHPYLINPENHHSAFQNKALILADEYFAKLRKFFYPTMCSIIADEVMNVAVSSVFPYIKFDMVDLHNVMTIEELLKHADSRSAWIKSNAALVEYTRIIFALASSLNADVLLPLSLDVTADRVKLKGIVSNGRGTEKLREIIPMHPNASKETKHLVFLCNDEEFNEKIYQLSVSIKRRNRQTIEEANKMITRYYDLLTDKCIVYLTESKQLRKGKRNSTQAGSLHKILSKVIFHLNNLNVSDVNAIINALQLAMVDEKTDSLKEKLRDLSIIQTAAKDKKETLIERCHAEKKLLEKMCPSLAVSSLNDQAFFSSSEDTTESTDSPTVPKTADESSKATPTTSSTVTLSTASQISISRSTMN